MAKSLLTRPNMAIFCASRFRFSSSILRFSVPVTTKLLAVRTLASEKLLPPIGAMAAPSLLRRRTFCTRATSDQNGFRQIDSPLMQSMENKIKEQLNAESVTVNDLYGDGRHVSIDVVSSAFEGQSAVNRQRMVYKAIWEELQQTVHAVDQMTTKTPTEATGNK
ncbi:protein BOLA4, chloroplastic/mitochondrial [Ipomoea triloba]|uniref:protein BOLA4, chloroplastic/mitochondrial n=1 Tax=Ipomoea triloba TaxID=35885 RepID=UPI00125E90D4|nr:protein BOLA4, chloroplastic/mitochondrial [Ipomoea triloba]GMC58029.1 protein BOLA4, chloroplastic/mitochondrial [Ipomoea batatas]